MGARGMAVGAVVLALGAPVLAQSDPEAVALLRATESLLRPGTSVSTSEVLVVRPEWQRTLRFRAHDDRANDRFHLEVLDPAKARGTVFLKRGRQLAMYLPKLRRVVSISPVMVHDEWMGSDFNNEDLLSAGTLIDDYTHRIVGRAQEGGSEVVAIESTPCAGSAVVWDRLVLRIRVDGVPLEMEYRDARGQPVRRLSFHDVREVGGRRLPTRWVMSPAGRPGHRTELRLERIEVGVPVPEDLFRLPTTAQGRP